MQQEGIQPQQIIKCHFTVGETFLNFESFQINIFDNERKQMLTKQIINGNRERMFELEISKEIFLNWGFYNYERKDGAILYKEVGQRSIKIKEEQLMWKTYFQNKPVTQLGNKQNITISDASVNVLAVDEWDKQNIMIKLDTYAPTFRLGLFEVDSDQTIEKQVKLTYNEQITSGNTYISLITSKIILKVYYFQKSKLKEAIVEFEIDLNKFYCDSNRLTFTINSTEVQTLRETMENLTLENIDQQREIMGQITLNLQLKKLYYRDIFQPHQKISQKIKEILKKNKPNEGDQFIIEIEQLVKNDRAQLIEIQELHEQTQAANLQLLRTSFESLIRVDIEDYPLFVETIKKCSEITTQFQQQYTEQVKKQNRIDKDCEDYLQAIQESLGNVRQELKSLKCEKKQLLMQIDELQQQIGRFIKQEAGLLKIIEDYKNKIAQQEKIISDYKQREKNLIGVISSANQTNSDLCDYIMMISGKEPSQPQAESSPCPITKSQLPSQNPLYCKGAELPIVSTELNKLKSNKLQPLNQGKKKKWNGLF